MPGNGGKFKPEQDDNIVKPSSRLLLAMTE